MLCSGIYLAPEAPTVDFVRMKIIRSLICLFGAAGIAGAATIPSNRLPATGYWNPGCIGNNGQTYRQSGTFIPPVVLTNVINVQSAPYNAVGDGVHDDTTNIQYAIAAANNSVVYLPAGTYKITGQLELGNPNYPWSFSSKILRGAGPTNTFIMAYNTSGGPFIDATSTGPGYSRAAQLSQLALKGSTTVTLNGWDSGGFFDSQTWGILYQSNSVAGAPWSGGQGYEEYAKCQIVHITGRNSSARTITFDTPAYFDWSTNTYFTVFYGLPSSIGIENLSIQNCGGLHTHNINFSGIFNSWIRNVQSVNAYNGHIHFQDCARCDVLDCYIHGYYPATDGSVGGGNSDYGIWFFGQSSDNLAANNFLDRTRHALIVEDGDTGNVFAYNYTQNSINEGLENTDFQMESMNSHGCTQWNLWEGNISGKFSMDNNLGGSINNFGFRNYMSRQALPPVAYGRWGYDIQVSNYWVSVVAGVIGNVNYSPTWREGAPNANGDIMGVQFPNPAGTPADPGATLYTDGVIDLQSNLVELANNATAALPYGGLTYPASLWLTAAPSFWGSAPWPAIGPDVPGYTSVIPAQSLINNYPSNQWPNVPVAGPINTNTVSGTAPPVSPSPGLVASYALAGTANDSSGYNNNGTLIGAPNFVNGVDGVAGHALALNGSSQAVGFSASVFSSYAPTTGTFSAWVNAANFAGGCIAYEAGTTANNFALSWPSSSTGTLAVNLGSNNGILSSKNNFTTGTFYHLAVTWDGSSVSIYVNGVLDSTHSGSNVPNLRPDGAGTQLGRYEYGTTAGAYFNGDIEDVRVYNYALTASAISAMYNAVTSTNTVTNTNTPPGQLAPPTQLKVHSP